MTAVAFNQSVTDAINVKLLDAQGREQALPQIYHATLEGERSFASSLDAERGIKQDDLAPHIAKIPLRSEYRDLIRASELYAEQAARHQGEADRLRQLASDAKTQAENLRRVAGL